MLNRDRMEKKLYSHWVFLEGSKIENIFSGENNIKGIERKKNLIFTGLFLKNNLVICYNKHFISGYITHL